MIITIDIERAERLLLERGYTKEQVAIVLEVVREEDKKLRRADTPTFKYEQGGVEFFCVGGELRYAVFVVPSSDRPPEYLARLYVEPTPELFISICQRWLKGWT